MILCAGRNETFPFAHPIGVGLIESAMGFTQLALFDKPEQVLFIGSAGSYGKHKPFDIVYSTVASQIETGFLSRQSYTPLDNVIEVQYEGKSHSTIVNSSNYITSDCALMPQFSHLGLALENMEFFSILSVAGRFEIPVLGLFVVTNYCDANAHRDFLSNHDKAKHILTSQIQQSPFLKGFM